MSALTFFKFIDMLAPVRSCSNFMSDTNFYFLFVFYIARQFAVLLKISLQKFLQMMINYNILNLFIFCYYFFNYHCLFHRYTSILCGSDYTKCHHIMGSLFVYLD